jgi:sigma-B regulation protein RsbU (phosphoserine phosphatase)
VFRLHVIPAHGDPFDQVLEGDSLIIGRSSAAELVLADRFLSRQHARLHREGEAWLIEDLGSRNGTLLNGTKVESPTKISAGDELRLSGSVIMVRSGSEPMREVPTTTSQESAQHTVFRRASDLISRQSSSDTAGLEAPDAVRRQADRLRLLNDVHRALNQSIELDDLLEMILARAFDELSPEEGIILMKNKEGEYFRAARKTIPGVSGKYAFSETLIHEVAEKGMAALVLDVETDERFAHAQSILSSGIRSLVAAPLLDAEGSLGMVALNSRVHKRQFDEEDMELLVSLASVAALRIRNVALAEEAAERRRLEEELKLARQIQVGLLPSQLPEVPGYEFHGGNVPSRGVSGDYFKVEPRKKNSEFVAVIADVSGKGMAASLLTASLEALSAGPIEVGQEAQEICTKVCRRLFHRTPPAKYATMFLGILEPATHKFTYTNAGHNPALVVRADGEVRELGTTGLPVGLMEVGNYTQIEIEFQPGDTLILYTDGITEAENPEEEEYGLERLIEACKKNRDKGLVEMSEAIYHDLDEFADGVPYADDRTLVLGRRLSS